MFRAAFLGLVSLVATAVLAVPQASAMDASMALPGDPSFVNLVSAEQALIDLTNADRAANGVDPLQLDLQTLPIARERAESQLGDQNLSHYDAAGQLIFAELLNQARVPYTLAGENLARAATDDTGITQRVEQALMQSPLHRKNILERTFKRVAIGAAIAQNGQIAFAELYRD
jgi:uncharacterized protein YkwD